jgi:hypothetical protein
MQLAFNLKNAIAIGSKKKKSPTAMAAALPSPEDICYQERG